jgi:hypothetical protein
MNSTSELHSDLPQPRGYADEVVALSAQPMSMNRLLLLYKTQLRLGCTRATLLRH